MKERTAEIAEVKERQYRIEILAPYIYGLKNRGFNVPLEFGGYRTLGELLNHIIICGTEEFGKLVGEMAEMMRVFSNQDEEK